MLRVRQSASWTSGVSARGECSSAEDTTAIERMFNVLAERVTRGKALLERTRELIGNLGDIGKDVAFSQLERDNPLKAWGQEMVDLQERIAEASGIDPWFVDQIAQVVEGTGRVRGVALHRLGALDLRGAKRLGISDGRLADLTGATEAAVRRHREALGVQPVFKTVDTCGGEFPARTPSPSKNTILTCPPRRAWHG